MPDAMPSGYREKLRMDRGAVQQHVVRLKTGRPGGGEAHGGSRRRQAATTFSPCRGSSPLWQFFAQRQQKNQKIYLIRVVVCTTCRVIEDVAIHLIVGIELAPTA